MRRYVAQAILAAAMLMAATIVLLVAAAFLAGALFLALRDVMSGPLAALVTGLAGVLVAALIALVGGLTMRRSKPARAEGQSRAPVEAQRLAGELGGIIGEEMASLARTHARGTAIASLLAGFAVGASPRLRRLLRDLLGS
jgi:hypothetical protein